MIRCKDTYIDSKMVVTVDWNKSSAVVTTLVVVVVVVVLVDDNGISFMMIVCCTKYVVCFVLNGMELN